MIFALDSLARNTLNSRSMRFLFAVLVIRANGNAPKIDARGYAPTGASHTTRHSMVSNHFGLLLPLCFRYLVV